MCKLLSRAFLFILTLPFVILFSLIYITISAIYLLFIKLPSYCCCHVICNNNNKYIDINNETQSLNELTHTIPHIETFMDSVKECLHTISGTKLCHHYLSYIFNNNIANKLVKIRYRFKNGLHETDIIKQKPFVTVYGGNNSAELEQLIQKTEEYDQTDEKVDTNLQITFTDLDSLSAAIAEYKEHNGSKQITILDLASRRHVGGWGWYPYGGTQEEDLIRCSNLYWLLNPKYNTELKQQLIEKNINDSHIPYFGTVYIPNVIFLSNLTENNNNEEYKFNVIASAAPDMRNHSNEYKSYFRKASVEQIKYVISKKIEAIFATTVYSKNTSILIAGAFGCGAYKCDTKLVAQCFKSVINSKKYNNKGIEKIVFAIAYDDKKLSVFRNILSAN